MTTPRGKLWFSKRREALKLGVEHQGLCAEHQKSVINHQKVDVGVTASTFNLRGPRKAQDFWGVLGAS